jgi:tetratricopeptide (TPR) repeat protein
MSANENLLSYFRKELNPSFKKAIHQALDRAEFPESGLLPHEVHKKKQKDEVLRLLQLEEKQKAFLEGVEALEKLYPTVLTSEEQKRFLTGVKEAQKRVAEAIKKVPACKETIAELCGISPYVLACMWRVANVAFQKNNLADACLIYRMILNLNENLDGIWTSYGQCLQASKRLPEAVEAFDNAHLLNPDYPVALIGLAQCAIALKNASAARHAIDLLKQCLKRTGKTEEYRKVLAELKKEV